MVRNEISRLLKRQVIMNEVFLDEICTELNSLDVKSILTDTKRNFSTNDVSVYHVFVPLFFQLTVLIFRLSFRASIDKFHLAIFLGFNHVNIKHSYQIGWWSPCRKKSWLSKITSKNPAKKIERPAFQYLRLLLL